MRILAQKPKSNQQSTSKTLKRAVDEQSRERNFLFNTQPAASHQATRPLPESQDEAPEINTAATHSAHDFSRIPLHSGERRPIQAKLRVGTPGDAYEQEADRVANHLLGMPEPQPALSEKPSGPNSLLQTKGEHNSNQQALAPPIVNEALNSSGQPLDSATKTFFEPRLGHNFSQVRVHADSRAAESAREVNALAYTVGRDIVFAAGQYEPQTTSGQRLLAHELTHVVQQAETNTGSTTAGVLQRADPPESAQPDDESTSVASYIDYVVNLITQATDYPRAAAAELDALIMNAVIELVKKIRRTKGTSINKKDEEYFRTIISAMSVKQLKEVEKTLTLWPEFGAMEKMTKLIEIVTSYSRQTNQEESERGRFEETEGGEKKQRMSEASLKFGFDECLNFLNNIAVDELFAGEAEKANTAQAAYDVGAAERKKKTITHAKTLSRLAAELRLQGLLGPVNILKWRGKGEKGHHEPEPAVVFDRLSDAGDGWYFFLVSVVSFHTFVIAVHVTGGNRVYFEIQGGQAVQKDKDQLREFFDKEFTNKEGAFSRVWQVYLRSTE